MGRPQGARDGKPRFKRGCSLVKSEIEESSDCSSPAPTVIGITDDFLRVEEEEDSKSGSSEPKSPRQIPLAESYTTESSNPAHLRSECDWSENSVISTETSDPFHEDWPFW